MLVYEKLHALIVSLRIANRIHLFDGTLDIVLNTAENSPNVHIATAYLNLLENICKEKGLDVDNLLMLK